MATDIGTEEERRCFEVLDDYANARHSCVVSELFPDEKLILTSFAFVRSEEVPAIRTGTAANILSLPRSK
jgi:hypothetical protein